MTTQLHHLQRVAAGSGQHHGHASVTAAAGAVSGGQSHCNHHPPALQPLVSTAGQAVASQSGVAACSYSFYLHLLTHLHIRTLTLVHGITLLWCTSCPDTLHLCTWPCALFLCQASAFLQKCAVLFASFVMLAELASAWPSQTAAHILPHRLSHRLSHCLSYIVDFSALALRFCKVHVVAFVASLCFACSK